MFTIILKNERERAEILATRALLAAAGAAAIVFSPGLNVYSRMLPAAALFILSLVVKKTMASTGWGRMLTGLLAAGLVLVATHALALAVVMVAYGFFFQALGKKKRVVVEAEGIRFDRFWGQRQVDWSLLSNVVLKDGILTLDFRNNHLLQSEIDESGGATEEEEFNRFCRTHLEAAVTGT